jgi:hypothetical protein
MGKETTQPLSFLSKHLDNREIFMWECVACEWVGEKPRYDNGGAMCPDCNCSCLYIGDEDLEDECDSDDEE